MGRTGAWRRIVALGVAMVFATIVSGCYLSHAPAADSGRVSDGGDAGAR